MAVKKVSEKKVSAKKNVKGCELVIPVPQGGQALATFELTPLRPVAGKAQDWKLIDTSTGETVTGISVSFHLKSSDVEREFERAVLIVNLAKSVDNAEGYWRFVLNGVEPGQVTGDQNVDVVTEITNYGRTLIAYVHALDLGKSEIDYGYLASFTDAISGVVSIYESRDPDIVVKRP
ncbi:MAG: DP-EP family protein [Pseudomonadota bacterium]